MKKLIEGKNYLCRVNPKDIAFINAVFEWFHEVATVRTRKPSEGLIELWIAPDFFPDAMKAVKVLKAGGYVERFEILKELGSDWYRS